MSEHVGTMKEGRFVPDDREAFSAACRAREGKRTAVKVGAITKDRTERQNSRMWAIYRKAALHFGYATAEELHTTFTARFTKDEKEIVRGTRNMTTIQHMRYQENVVRTLAEFGYAVPPDMIDLERETR